ncbi:sodium-coupled neutral amino acid transporter 9 homolog isoform X2 [Diabrotica undecimpunctata]|uniref:sodium-coupled neutral amino acid transporter 9 homolog isoform X2 n=1 Tax=Diabrotica undecimpunctata TaxID=50387 RepID=UPI003B63A4D7
MIFYSSVTMRDLIRKYKLIIQGKHLPDTDSELLISSTSSPGNTYNMDVGNPRLFQQGYSSTESEDDSPEKTSTLNSQQYKPKKEHVLSRSYNNSLNMDNHNNALYDVLQHSSLNEIISETTKLSFRFAIWNTTVGTSLLAMAWGMEKTGLFPGILINLFVVAVCLYTAYVLLKIFEKHGGDGIKEVPDLCRLLIGRWAEIVSKIFSLVVLMGGDIVYWILMSNFLYNCVVFVYDNITDIGSKQIIEDSVLCPKKPFLLANETHLVQTTTNSSPFYQIWQLYSTVPIFLAVLLFPLLNFKSPTFFTKFNSLGTLSVGYLFIFVSVKSFQWGINISDWTVEFSVKPTFCVLSGMLGMSYFIHNIIISIMKQNKHQNHNGRDLSIAFGLVCFTYLFLGVVFYTTFPLAKSCIEDNLLNNFSKKDVMALIARILLFFQLFTVYPFVTYMLRADILTAISMIFGKERNKEFSYIKTIIINFSIVFICILFACFMPRIGTLIRYTGALSGLIYIFVMPSLLKMASLKQEGALSIPAIIIHVIIIILGILNLISQFFITD